MGEEVKTTKQLEEEYNTLLAEQNKLLREKLDASKKEKEAQELAAHKQKEEEQFEEKFKAKYGLTSTSRLEGDNNKHSINMTADQQTFENWKADVIARKQKKGKNVRGIPYEEFVKGFRTAGCD